LALTRTEKEQLVQEYSDMLGRSQVLIWSQFTAIDVAQMSAFRRQVRANGSEVAVVKNTLLQRALQDKGLPLNDDLMSGPNLVAFVYDDIAATARTLNEFARTSNERFKIMGGIVGDKLATAEQIQSLADLPSREVLLARVLGGIQAPISGLAGTLAAVVRGILNVLNARAEQLEGSAS
jgi:large subunit ribosomal protein L10